MITVYSINERKSDEYSVCVVGENGPHVVAIYHKHDRARNRELAIGCARSYASINGFNYIARHNLSGRKYDQFLPLPAKAQGKGE